MLGHKDRDFRPLTAVSLEDLVPDDNLYRHLEEHLDLGFIRDLVCELYSETGRPSIDPVVFFKLQLIAFFEGIRSERRLMETVNVNMAHRWFIGYDLTEEVPDHSSLSKIRDRYGLPTFHRFFERIVELCIEAGLVWGEELYFDSTKVQANASIDRLMPRVEWEAQQHLDELFESKVDAEVPDCEATTSRDESSILEDKFDPQKERPTVLTLQELVEKYNCPEGQILRLSSRRKSEQVHVYTAEASICNASPPSNPPHAPCSLHPVSCNLPPATPKPPLLQAIK